MKKLLYLCLLTFGFALTAEAQTKKTTEKINPEQQATTDVSDITKLISVEEWLVEDIKTLQVMRYQAINDAPEESTKSEIKKRFGDKLKGAFNEEQLNKLNTNPALYKRLFE
jgi:DNA-binding protein YbaB